MRPDITKLLCENPRAGSRYKGYHEIRSRQYDISEDAPARESMKKPYGWNTKDLTEYFAPFYRFLEGAVGRKWDDVYSEIRKNLRMEKATHFHVMQHLYHFVERNVYMKDGVVYQRARWGGADFPVNDTLYIHPETGILSRAKQVKRVRWSRPKQDTDWVWVDDTHAFIEKEGLWYYCELKVPPQTETITWTTYDGGVPERHRKVVPGTGYDSLKREWISYPAKYVVKHRSASKKELKKYDLHGLLAGSA